MDEKPANSISDLRDDIVEERGPLQQGTMKLRETLGVGGGVARSRAVMAGVLKAAGRHGMDRSDPVHTIEIAQQAVAKDPIAAAVGMNIGRQLVSGEMTSLQDVKACEADVACTAGMAVGATQEVKSAALASIKPIPGAKTVTAYGHAAVGRRLPDGTSADGAEAAKAFDARITNALDGKAKAKTAAGPNLNHGFAP